MDKLFESWRAHLHETSNPDFLDELEPLLTQWSELQSGYGASGENIPAEKLPTYTQKAPGYYKQWTHHPSGRRAVYAQTAAEETLEKDLVRLFMKHSDQNYLVNGITWLHDLSYKAHAQSSWSQSGLQFADFSRSDWVKAQGQRQRDVLSCHGFDKSIDAPRAGSYGMIIKPTRVLYASKGDLATQTLRTAHADVRARFSNKLPKRPGMDKLKSDKTGKSMRMYADWRKWVRGAFKQLPAEQRTEELWGEISTAMRDRDSQSPAAIAIADKLSNILKAANIDTAPKPKAFSRAEIRTLRDNTLLNQADVMSNNGKIEEALMANWEIVGWYALSDPRGGLARPEFWKSILPKITVPFYGIDQFANTFKEITLEELELLINGSG
jgi:hypothetical protein